MDWGEGWEKGRVIKNWTRSVKMQPVKFDWREWMGEVIKSIGFGSFGCFWLSAQCSPFIFKVYGLHAQGIINFIDRVPPLETLSNTTNP